jgi:UDP-N-acetylglucosamine 4-epimerase
MRGQIVEGLSPDCAKPSILEAQKLLKAAPRTWLVTGVAGFIGSHLLQTLLSLGQRVVGVDNLSTGKAANLEQVKLAVGAEAWRGFQWIEADIRDLDVCRHACEGVEIVSHHAAMGSVPLSLADPLGCHANNVTGFVNLLEAARNAGVRRFIYASSSAVYGDDQGLPKVEDRLGRPLSPYAATKLMNELYAGVFARCYGFASIGLRYFNVFGPQQDPEGAYAAVIPKWVAGMLRREPIFIYGDGETSRDFCFVENVVQANLLAATVADPAALNTVYNIALGRRTTLNQLFAAIERIIRQHDPKLPPQSPQFREFRPGDVAHSMADISRARRLLGYEPATDLEQGLEKAMPWYVKYLVGSSADKSHNV